MKTIKYPKDKSKKSYIRPRQWKLNIIERNKKRLKCKGEIHHGQGKQKYY